MPNFQFKRSPQRWLILWFTTFCVSGLFPVSAKDVEGDPLHAEIKSLARRLDTLEQNSQVDRDQLADTRIFLKGAIWARDGKPGRDATTQTLIEQAVRRATERVNALQSTVTDGKRPSWCDARGKLLRGFKSDVDGSTQPYGLSIPAGYDPAQPIRLDVVLHGSHGGRASPTGDLQFINAYDAGDKGTSPPDVNYIELFPMGRLGENAYRFEGETDVFEAIEAVCRNYTIDRNRIVLRGSSLGGVGSWQIGLKRPDLFVAVGPTAGPVDTIEFANSPWPHFVRLDPLTPWQQRMLHQVDAIDYTANARMVPIVAAMGDQDHYFSSHLLMQKSFEKEGLPFVGLVDQGGGHGVRAPVIAEQLRLLGGHAAKGRSSAPRHVHFVTWTLKYSRCFWVEVLGLDEHYVRAEIDARVEDNGAIVVAEPTNISRFALNPAALPAGIALSRVTIGKTQIDMTRSNESEKGQLVFERVDGRWRFQGLRDAIVLTGKRPGLSGPIDDAFATRFLCVRGTGKPWNRAIGDWSEANLARFTDEWHRHYRGNLPVKNDTDVTDEDVRNCNLILFGDPGSNRWIERIVPKLALHWTREEFRLGGKRYVSTDHAPELISPNPLPGAQGRYVVFNSGHTYHEAELRFSYMVFPRLGDWAVVKVGESQPEDGVDESVLESGFFDEQWRDKRD